jgi:hypothetical protein
VYLFGKGYLIYKERNKTEVKRNKTEVDNFFPPHKTYLLERNKTEVKSRA